MRRTKGKQQKCGRLDIKQCIAENLTFGATLKCKNIKLFAAIIKAMSFVNNTEMQLSDVGLKYIAEESRSFQVRAYVPKDLFSDYFIKVPHGIDKFSFGINLTSFTDLLSGFIESDDRSSMIISYFDRENKIAFSVIQHDSGETGKSKAGTSHYDEVDQDDDKLAGEIRTEYFLRTMDSINPIDFVIDNLDAEEFHTLILNASDFLHILNVFDRTIIELNIKITQKRMTLRSVGVLQYEISSKHNSDSRIFDKYEIRQPSQFSYRSNYFKVMSKGLVFASKVSIITQQIGTMRVQLMVPSDDEPDPKVFIEYNMIPNLPDEDDSENDKAL